MGDIGVLRLKSELGLMLKISLAEVNECMSGVWRNRLADTRSTMIALLMVFECTADYSRSCPKSRSKD